MEIQVNDNAQQLAPGSTVAQLLSELKINTRFLAVERNGEIVRRHEYERCRLSAGDRIEIVTLVGGG